MAAGRWGGAAGGEGARASLPAGAGAAVPGGETFAFIAPAHAASFFRD